MAYKDIETRREAARKLHLRKKNDPDYRAYRKQVNDSLRQKKQKNILEYLLTHPCLDCGENDPIVLEFDHLGNKFLGVSQMISSNYSMDRLWDEVAKCEVVCSNCHKRRTAKRGNFWKVCAL